MSRRPVWITGAGGLIGNSLVELSGRYTVAPVVGWTRARLELTDFAAVRGEFARRPPQLVFHCAALSRSAECQEKPAAARRANVEATALLADLASDIPFVFFSTDLVFDGRQGNYDESAAPRPLSVYGETKVEAERAVLANPRHLVVRTSLNGGRSPTGDRGFNEQMRNAWRAGVRTRLFTDEFRSPTPAQVTAQAAWELALQGRAGLYHVAGSERLSRWELGLLLAARWPGLQPKIDEGMLKEYSGAPRPADSSLNCAKAQRALSFPLPRFSEWLAAQPPGSF